MILHRYFARRYLKVFLGVLVVFFALLALVDLVEQMRRVDDSVSFGEVLRLTLLSTPEGLYQILPLVMILSAVVLFLSLARSSELVVARASGRAALSTLMAPVAVALGIGLLAVSVGNPIVAATSKKYQELREFYRSGGAPTLSIGREGLWLRQGGPEGQAVIRADRANAEATELYDVSFVIYAPDGRPERRIMAETAALGPGGWELTGVTSWALAPGVNPQDGRETAEEMTVPTSLTQDAIRDSFGSPSAISVWQLPAFIEGLEESGFSARRHQVWLQMELARPLFLVAMLLVGAAFTMRHSRFGGTGPAVLTAVLLGFGLYYVRNFAQILGENGQLDPVLAAWTPPVASVILALGLIVNMEDG